MDEAPNGPLVCGVPCRATGGLGSADSKVQGEAGPDLDALLRVNQAGGKGQVPLSPTHLMCRSPWFPDSAVATHIAPSIPKEFS